LQARDEADSGARRRKLVCGKMPRSSRSGRCWIRRPAAPRQLATSWCWCGSARICAPTKPRCAKNIPFLTSRRGQLLDTLEAGRHQALLLFLIAPFADLQLAQVLRSPIFSCADEDDAARRAAD
jgi:hypothetical protein